MRLALNYRHVDPTRGGAETYVVDLCQRLVGAGHAVDLYAETWSDGVLPPEIRCTAVPAAGRTGFEKVLSFARNSELAIDSSDYDCTVGFINTWHHDVIIPQGGVHGGSLEANAKRFPPGWRRTAYILGKKANPKFWAYREIEARQYDLTRPVRVVAVSRMVMEHVRRFHHVPGHRIHVIPNAIETRRFDVEHPAAVRCALRNKLGLAPGELVGLFVGHNYWLKGLKPLLHALAYRRDRGAASRPIKLVVCGGKATGPFLRMAKRLGLADSVRFLGYYPDVRSCFWASDFFASPTYYDPCSLVVFEALACGLPVITTACNGASELMTDGREGYVVTEPAAVGELAAALDHMADDAARSAMSAHASALGREQSMDRHVAALVGVFEEVAAMKSRRGPRQTRGGSEESRTGRKFIRPRVAG